MPRILRHSAVASDDSADMRAVSVIVIKTCLTVAEILKIKNPSAKIRMRRNAGIHHHNRHILTAQTRFICIIRMNQLFYTIHILLT